MRNKILVFDTDSLCHHNLASIFKSQDMVYAIETVADHFIEKLTTKGPWDEVLINFQQSFFSEHTGSDIGAFIQMLHKKHPPRFLLTAVTGDPYQKEILKRCGARVIYKGYFPADFGSDHQSVIIPGLTIPGIKKVVATHLQVPISMLDQRTRKRQIVEARQISMYLSKLHTRHSLNFIGQSFNGRNHATVRHSVATVKDLMDTNPSFKENVLMIKRKIAAA